MRHAKHSAKIEKTRQRFVSIVDENGGQAAAAFRLGCSLSMVNQICTGEKLPGLKLTFRIEKAFKIDMHDWCDDLVTETVKRFA